MSARHELSSVLSRIGLLIREDEDGQRKALGSCFSVRNARVFVTAAHCVEGIPHEELLINHHGARGREMLTRALRVRVDHDADIAVVETEAPDANFVVPFGFISHGVRFGEDVYSAGFPVDSAQLPVSREDEPHLRFFRGIIQRPFIHESTVFPGVRYAALELSFAVPRGLSGAPVFLADDPLTVIGVLTENLEVDKERLREEKVRTPDQTHTVEQLEIIRYGIAVHIGKALGLLEEILGEIVPLRSRTNDGSGTRR